MKQFIIRLAAMAAMTAAIVACDKENLDPAPDNGRNESIVELTLKNESAADRTRAFGAGTTEGVGEVDLLGRADRLQRFGNADPAPRTDLLRSDRFDIDAHKLVLPGVDADTSCDFYVVINRTVADNITTETALLAELESDIASYNGTYANVTTKAMRSGGFVMTGTATAKIVSRHHGP